MSVLDEAAAVVGGPRMEQYGPPSVCFRRIAGYWASYLQADIRPRDVAHMMILVKIARDQNSPKRDNWVDIAGYARVLELLGVPAGGVAAPEPPPHPAPCAPRPPREPAPSCGLCGATVGLEQIARNLWHCKGGECEHV